MTHETTMQLVSDRELVITRTFSGPPALVFRAWTEPDLVKLWWAPAGLGVRIVSVEADVRPGGSYRYVIAAKDDLTLAFSGEYSEVTSPDRLVYTQVFEPAADAGPVLVTVTFEATAGGTRMTSHEIYPSAEAREATLAVGMEQGMRMTMDQLDALVRSLAERA